MMAISHPNVIGAYSYYPENPKLWCNGHGSEGGDALVFIMMQPAMGGEVQDSFWRKVNLIADYTGGFHKMVANVFGDSVKKKRRDAKVRLLGMMVVQLLRGLTEIHRFGYIHGDLKPENIWSTTPSSHCIESLSCNWVIGDLGMLVAPTRSLTTADGTTIDCAPARSGTPMYMPPEADFYFTTQDKLDEAKKSPDTSLHCNGDFDFWTQFGDVWALGYSLLFIADHQGFGDEMYMSADMAEDGIKEILQKRNPFKWSHARTDDDVQMKLLSQAKRRADARVEHVKQKSYIPQGLMDILVSMTDPDVTKRPSAADALKSAEAYFLAEYDQAAPEGELVDRRLCSKCGEMEEHLAEVDKALEMQASD
jgi:serine/threonine protein kinase